jgi:hypothetical protein
MFEDKINEQERELLLGHLNALWSYGWRSVLLSEQLYTFTILRHLNRIANPISYLDSKLFLMYI